MTKKLFAFLLPGLTMFTVDAAQAAMPQPNDAGTVSNQTTSATETSVPVKFGGYVDAQFRNIKDDGYNSGFVVNDGALYVSHTMGDFEAMIDIPFTWEQQYKAGNDIDGDGISNGFAVGGHKAQAYLAYTMGATRFQFGQFDTFYGFEVNDAPEITFSTQGLIYAQALPITHTGVMATHKIGGFTGRLMGANVSNQGANQSQKSEYGAQVGWANENFRIAAGYLTYAKFENEMRNLIDGLAGLTFGGFSLDVEYISIREPSAATAPATGFTSETGTGLLIQPAYQITPSFQVAGRYEMVSKFLPATNYEQNQTTLGVQYQVNRALRTKVDYSFGQNQAVNNGPKTDTAALRLAGVYRF